MAKFTPQNYKYEPELWLANQSGHMALGAVSSIIVCLIWLTIFGEFPYRHETWSGIAALYFIYEIWDQKWNGADTIEDTIFVGAYGAGAILHVVREVSPGTGEFRGNVYDLAPFIIIGGGHLALGFFLRIRNARGTR